MFFFLCLFLFFLPIPTTLATPLDDYVNTPDPSYSWKVTTTIREYVSTVYNVFLTSQRWLTANDTSNPVWTHWLQVCIPDHRIETDIALIYVDGGGTANVNFPPTETDTFISIICQTSGLIAAHLSAIPNQPIQFVQDPKQKSRSEDAIIAYTWAHFLNHTDQPQWLLRMPMTKAVVRAMDAITEFTETNGAPIIKRFVVGGASKRGWTTWTTGAVDKRVVGLVPVVAPVGNLIPQMNLMWRAYGNWSFALKDYTDENLLYYLNSGRFEELLHIIDPLTYVDRLTMPKLMICATGDEFFMTDAVNYMWDQLSEPKLLRLVPNAEHSLVPQQIDIVLGVQRWILTLIEEEEEEEKQKENKPDHESLVSPFIFPRFNWTISNDGETIQVLLLNPTETQPVRVTVWSSYHQSLRDFRLIRCGETIPECFNPAFWLPQQLNHTGDGTTYKAHFQTPEVGWRAFLVELAYPGNTELDHFKVTTDVSIIPKRLPFPPCPDEECNRPPPSTD